MNINNQKTTQLTVSYELLLLLKWLISHEEERLKKIVQKALVNGLQKELTTVSRGTLLPSTDDLQYNITDFFNLLELLLHDLLTAQMEQKAVQKKLIPALEQIDLTVCDSEAVRMSIEHAWSALETNPTVNAKDALFSELIKRWKPSNKIMH